MIIPSIFGYDPQLVYDDVVRLCENGISHFHFDVFDESINKQPYSGLNDISFFCDLFNTYHIIKNIHLISRQPLNYFTAIIANEVEEVILHPDLLTYGELEEAVHFLQKHRIRVGLSYNEIFNKSFHLHMDFIHVCNYDYLHDEPLSDKQILSIISGCNNFKKPILVDGGVCRENIAIYKTAGASFFVCGKSLFSSDNPLESYNQLYKLIK